MDNIISSGKVLVLNNSTTIPKGIFKTFKNTLLNTVTLYGIYDMKFNLSFKIDELSIDGVPTTLNDAFDFFVENSANSDGGGDVDLSDYYTKAQTDAEIQDAIATLSLIKFESVDVLPTTGQLNIIYLVPSSTVEANNVKDEFIWVNGAWELIGSTDVNLDNFYTKTEINTLLGNKQNTLVSGTNIKTLDGQSLLGNGNIVSPISPISKSANNGLFRTDRVAGNYLTLGQNAVDLSTSSTSGNGASGLNSIAMGSNSRATDECAFSIGLGTVASGYNSIAMGAYTTASGYRSTAFGMDSKATGGYTTAIGYNASATGGYSVSIGFNTITSGQYSTAFGTYTTATSYSSTVLGRYNVLSTVETTWTIGSPIFVVGNGTSDSTRSNAYVLNNNGTSTQFGIASYNADYSADYTNRSLVDKAYVDSPKDIKFISLSTSNAVAWNGSIALGTSNTYGSSSLGVGGANVIMSTNSISVGTANQSNGNNSASFGMISYANADNSASFGFGTRTDTENSFAIGKYNIATNVTNALFVIGNGEGSFDERSDAYRFFSDGTSTQFGIASYNADYSANYTDRSLVDKAYVDSKSTSTDNNFSNADKTNLTNAITHIDRTDNPHNVTKTQIGLSNVDNTSDVNKPISTATNEALSLKADLVNGIVSTNQLPSYVDNVQEYADLSGFPTTGLSNVVYLSIDTNKPYRWGGSSYVEISSSGVAIGETNATAYRGDRGKIAYDHTTSTNNPHNVTKAQVGLSNVDNTSDLNKPISTATKNYVDNNGRISTQVSQGFTINEYENRIEYLAKIPFNLTIPSGAARYSTISTSSYLPVGVTIDGCDEFYISFRNNERGVSTSVHDNASRRILLGFYNSWEQSVTTVGTAFIKLIKYK